jgi:hypothetical protein
MRCYAYAAFVSVVLAATPAIAGPLNAQTIVQGMKRALEPDRPSTRTLVVAVRATDGSTTEWTARQARKRLPDGNRILTVILEPDDLRGVGLLIREEKVRPDDQWLYLPMIRRVRQILPVSAYESFLGSDFTLADLGFVNLRDRKFSLLGEETVAETPAYKVQEVLAGPHYYYSRIVSWIAKDTMLPMERDYYDAANQLWKTELYQNTTVINGIPTVLRIRMDDRLQDTGTELRVSEVRYDATIPDDLFDPQKLPQASKHPLWTSTGP